MHPLGAALYGLNTRIAVTGATPLQDDTPLADFIFRLEGVYPVRTERGIFRVIWTDREETAVMVREKVPAAQSEFEEILVATRRSVDVVHVRHCSRSNDPIYTKLHAFSQAGRNQFAFRVDEDRLAH